MNGSDVSVLLQALPYIRHHARATFVIKCGGEIARDPEALEHLATDVALPGDVVAKRRQPPVTRGTVAALGDDKGALPIGAAGEQETEHDPGGPAAGNATTGLHRVDRHLRSPAGRYSISAWQPAASVQAFRVAMKVR